MKDELGVPPELRHLIEKRDVDDRRADERRCASAGAGADGEPAPPVGADRRSGVERRKKKRRKKRDS